MPTGEMETEEWIHLSRYYIMIGLGRKQIPNSK